MQTLEVHTEQRSQFVELSDRVRQSVFTRGVQRGWAVVFVPHTTAGITINENADPDVVHDITSQLDRMVPWDQPYFRHTEGNSAAHVKASMMGSSVQVPVQDGHLLLGRWQGIWFCEFDGPRMRRVLVDVRVDTLLIEARPAP